MPRGWFAVAHEDEVRGGVVITRRIGDSERVLFRDGRGVLAVVDPHCPHLGAHLGHGGRVVEGALQCPFHGLRFDAAGAVVHVPNGSRAPRRARLRTHPVLESGGWVFTWLDPDGAPPTWRPPVLEDRGWGRLRTCCVPLRTHPQETTENSVDLGHFPFVHGYREVALHTLEVDGPHLHTRYSFVRPQGLPLLGGNLRVEIDVHVWGLGFSYVDVFLPAVGVHTRHYVLPTPVAADAIELRLGTAIRRGLDPAWVVRWLPGWLFDGVVGWFAMRGYVHDVLADREIWEHKVHLARPALLAGDDPIAKYRAWVRQFYS